MSISEKLEEDKIREALAIIKPDGQLFEIRILQGKQTISGYFTSVETLLKEFNKVSLKGANVFYTLNQIDPACYAREQHDCFRQCKTTTSDADIVAYNWMLIDLDPIRRTGISSTAAELTEAYNRGLRIVEYLRELSFPAPVMACSGNGIHLLYQVYLANTKENARLIENCLKALALLFNDEKVEVDTSVFNPARISKLYGTMAQKGSSTKDRPHRMSRIISAPPVPEVAKKEALERLAEELPPEQPKRIKKNGFDIEGWLEQYGLRVATVKTWKDTTKYVLEECPFDGSHRAPDSAVIRQPNGAICFKCLHNSCRGHDWHELRLKYEPDAYDDKTLADEQRIEAGWKAYKAYNRNRQDITYTNETADEDHPEKMFETARDILNKPREERIYIKTGLSVFDKKAGGLAKGEITLVSGLRASGKSSMLSQWVLNAIDQDYNTIVYSGELKDTRFMNWMYQQAAGKAWVKESKVYEDCWYCDESIKGKVADWLGDKFRLYNNDFGSNFQKLAKGLNNIIRELQGDLVVIDNMSILDLSDITDDRRADKWDQQKLFVETLKNLAMVCNCHIIFVAHPRKSQGFLRLDDVGGSGSLGNLVDNALIVHRVNRDFLRGYRRDILGLPEVTRKKSDDEEDVSGYDLGGDNCIEVVKERENGLQDLFIPLWYEKPTRRLKNSPLEQVIYGWDFDGFIGRQADEIPPF